MAWCFFTGSTTTRVFFQSIIIVVIIDTLPNKCLNHYKVKEISILNIIQDHLNNIGWADRRNSQTASASASPSFRSEASLLDTTNASRGCRMPWCWQAKTSHGSYRISCSSQPVAGWSLQLPYSLPLQLPGQCSGLSRSYASSSSSTPIRRCKEYKKDN